MAKIPKYVERLLERRERLALELMCVSTDLDKYCERIGIPDCSEEACLCTDVMIYLEPWSAKMITRDAIEKQLRENEEKRNAEDPKKQSEDGEGEKSS